MKKGSGILSLFLAFALVAVIFSGCGTTNHSPSTSSAALTTNDTSKTATEPAGLARQWPEFAKHHSIEWTLVDTAATGPDGTKDIIAPEIEKRTNLLIKYKPMGCANNDAYTQKLNLMVASGDIPDVLAIFSGDLEKNMAKTLGMSGKVWDIAPLIKDYKTIDKLIKPELNYYKDTENKANWFIPFQTGKGQITPYNQSQCIFVRDDFLKKLNMDYPTTPEELYTYLKRCKEEIKSVDGKPIIGLLLPENVASTGGGMLTWTIMRMFYPLPSDSGSGNPIMYPSGFAYDIHDNFKVYNYMYTDSDVLMRAAKYLNKLYREGLMDKDVAMIKTSQYQEKASSGRVSALSAWNWDANTFTDNSRKVDPECSFVSPPLIYDKTNGCLKYPNDKYTAYIGGAAMIISKKLDEETVRHLMAACDYLATKEGQILINYGIEGKTFNYDGNGKINYTDEFKKETNNLDGNKLYQTGVTWYANLVNNQPVLIDLMDPTVYWRPEEIKGYKNLKNINDLLDLNMEPDKTYFMTSGTEEKNRMPGIDQAFSEMFVSVIMAKSDAEVEQVIHDYAKKCKDLGIDSIVAERQKTLDNMVIPADN